MESYEWEILARLTLGAIGTMWLGGYAELSILIAIPLVAVWIYYAATYPLHRVTTLLSIAAVATFVVSTIMEAPY